MSKVRWLALLAAVAAMGLAVGCEDDDDDDSSGGGGGTTSGSYAGTWVGHVGGRGLTMVMNQNGTSLSGTYTFSDPTFSGAFAGSVSSATPPATARLDCVGRDWWFDINFASYNSLSGGFYKPENGGAAVGIDAAK